jgi:hypothetical protein
MKACDRVHGGGAAGWAEERRVALSALKSLRVEVDDTAQETVSHLPTPVHAPAELAELLDLGQRRFAEGYTTVARRRHRPHPALRARGGPR